jgi:hypothetical protein
MPGGFRFGAAAPLIAYPGTGKPDKPPVRGSLQAGPPAIVSGNRLGYLVTQSQDTTSQRVVSAIGDHSWRGKVMTCTREPVKMSGVLNGGGRKAYCAVSALRVALSGTRLFKNCRYSIDWVAIPLPHGDYELSVEGMIVNMCYSELGWRATEV